VTLRDPARGFNLCASGPDVSLEASGPEPVAMRSIDP
jgi:hypothetical protein